MTKLRIATVAGDVDTEASLAVALAHRSDADLILRCLDRVEVMAAIEGGSLDGAVVVGLPRWLTADDVVAGRRAGINMVGVAARPDDVAPLQRLGTDVVGVGVSVEVVLDRLRSKPPVEETSRGSDPAGKVTAVWGPKGAPGRTRVALELAYLAGSSGIATCLVDADPYGGDISQLLGLSPDAPALPYLSRHADDLDALTGVLTWATVVPGLVDPMVWRDVSLEGWRELLSRLRHRHAMTICDVGFCLDPPVGTGRTGSGPDRCEIARRSVETADQVVAVFRGDPVGVKHLLWGYGALSELIGPDRVILVANHVASGDERALAEAVRLHLGRAPDAMVPARPERVADAMRKGQPVAAGGPTSDFVRSLDPVADRLGIPVPARGILARLGGKA